MDQFFNKVDVLGKLIVNWARPEAWSPSPLEVGLKIFFKNCVVIFTTTVLATNKFPRCSNNCYFILIICFPWKCKHLFCLLRA